MWLMRMLWDLKTVYFENMCLKFPWPSADTKFYFPTIGRVLKQPLKDTPLTPTLNPPIKSLLREHGILLNSNYGRIKNGKQTWKLVEVSVFSSKYACYQGVLRPHNFSECTGLKFGIVVAKGRVFILY